MFNFIEGDRIGFSPDHDEYSFMIGVKTENIEIGYKHKCYHPIYPYSEKYNFINQVTVLEGSFDEVYIKFNTKVDLKI